LKKNLTSGQNSQTVLSERKSAQYLDSCLTVIAKDRGCPTRFEYFIKGTVPTERENLHQPVLIDKSTGDMAPIGKTDNVEMQDHQILKDPVSTYCLDCPHPAGSAVFIHY